MNIPNHLVALDHMLAAWNEGDSNQVRAHLDLALASEIRFVDPTIDLRGIDAFETMVHDVHARVPNAVYSRISEIDSHHDLHRYHWAVHVAGELALQGFDVAEVKAGKVTSVIGFFGDLPVEWNA